ncbi:MAG: glycosyltransferase [Christensenellales bacterium]
MSRVSIAITTYNGERYIFDQLFSIINQTRKADEVIIFDDASADKTTELVRQFIDDNHLEHWKLTVNKTNIGFINNFYNAIKSTTGDIIFLCDQDDVWYSDKIEKMVSLFESKKEIKALNTSFCKVDENGNLISSGNRFHRSNHNLILGHIKEGVMKKFDFDYIIWRNISPGCTSAFRSDCKALFLDNATKLCPHDWELNIFGAILDGLYFYNVVLMDYRIHTQNTIGLVKLSLSSRISNHTNRDKILKRAGNEADRAEAFMKNPFQYNLNGKQKKTVQAYRRLTAIRLNMIQRKRFLNWLAVCGYMHNYLKLMGIQGIIDDLKYCIWHK